MTTTSNMIGRLKEWEKSNPLREWREKNKISRQSVAGALGVTQGAVVAWEAGSNRPTDDNMAAIIRLTEDTKLPRKWDDWRNSSPAK